jgi:hypothetical protein
MRDRVERDARADCEERVSASRVTLSLASLSQSHAA